MKLQQLISKDDATACFTVFRASEKTLGQLVDAMTIYHGLIRINSPESGCNCARLRSVDPTTTGHTRIDFVPFLLKCWTVWDSKRRELNMLVCELTAFGKLSAQQMAFTPASQFSSRFTLNGPGTLDARQGQPENEISDLLRDHKDQGAVRRLTQWIGDMFPARKLEVA